MDGQTNRPKPICPFNFFEVGGHNNALMYKLCPWQAQYLWPFYHLTYKCDLDLQNINLRFFFTKNPNLKLKLKKWEGGAGVDGWTDEQAQTNLPLQLLWSWGHNNALMYKLWPWQGQFMTILSFDLQVWPLPSTYVNKYFKGNFYYSKTTTVLNYFEIHA